MAKNAQGSWVGTTAAPQFKTYQTAGQLQPTPASSTPTSVTPPPPTSTPLGPITLPDFSNIPPVFPGGIFNGSGQNILGQAADYLFPQQATAAPSPQDAMTPERQRLVNAIIGSGTGRNARNVIPIK